VRIQYKKLQGEQIHNIYITTVGGPYSYHNLVKGLRAGWFRLAGRTFPTLAVYALYVFMTDHGDYYGNQKSIKPNIFFQKKFMKRQQTKFTQVPKGIPSYSVKKSIFIIRLKCIARSNFFSF